MFGPAKLELWLSALLVFGALPVPQDATDPFEVRLRHARTAMEAGDSKAAAQHLQHALVFRPWSEEVLALLFQNSSSQADAQILWAHRLWDALSDDKGKLRGKAGLSAELLRVAPGAEGLAVARAAAVRELARLCAAERKKAPKDPAAGLVARWLADCGWGLADSMPALLETHGEEFDFEFEVPRRHIDLVIKAVKHIHSRATSRGDHSTAVRAARILRGLAAQGSFKDLQGPKPSGISALNRWAVEALGKSRSRLGKDLGEPLTIEQLVDMDEDEAREFSLIHSDLAFPGVALSPRADYRIETCCGFETLLGVAETVEPHHDRLVNWYGQNPFEGRPGLVRILPEAAGLESEGAGFWWVGGFQGGDTTTLRFSCGTIEGLGHGIVHELTHRFDGAIYPGTPAWLAEGKAVWTGGSYGSSYDEEFVEDHIQFGTVESAWMKGYGGEQKLRDLILGEIEDYRDNYVAGYALYVYLKLWQQPDGKPVYYDRLERFMRGLRDRNKDPLAWFVQNFADGKDGRPEDFPAFAVAFHEFVSGFYWDDRAPWTSNYISRVDQAGGDWVYDTSTWTWSRNRAEPWWGQDQAWRAGDLALDLDRTEDAGDAYLWAWTVDEHSPRRSEKLARVLDSLREDEAAWVLRNNVLRHQLRSRADTPPPVPVPLHLPKTQALLGEYARAAGELAAAGRTRAASAVAAEHNRLAAWLGEPAIETTGPGTLHDLLHPWDKPAQRLGLDTPGDGASKERGWTESGLTGYEERRVRGCWYVEPDGDLHVGRSRPRDSTGILDRRAHNRHAFALTRAKQPGGRYAIRCKVQFTTSYASGALILGYQRRDRNVRFSFSAGDFYYSIGKKEQGEDIERVAWSVSGLRDRDGPMSGSVFSGGVSFESPRSSFELEAIVDGAAVHFWIEGQYLGAYHDALGTPIAGQIGFATGMGALRIIDPTLQRLDRSRQLGLALSGEGDEVRVDAGLDLRQPTPTSFRRLINRPVAGMVPDPCGTLLVWVPLPTWEPEQSEELLDECVAKALKMASSTGTMLYRAGANQPLLIVLPDKLDGARVAALREELSEELEGFEWRTLSYDWKVQTDDSEEGLFSQHRPWLCFIDSAGILRSCDRFYGFNHAFPDEMMHWIIVFRDDDGQR